MAARKKVERIREKLTAKLESQVHRKDKGLTPDTEGQQVRLRGVGGRGTLVKFKDRGRRAEVQMGPKRLEVDTEALELLPVQQDENVYAVRQNGIRVIRAEGESCRQKLDLIGLRVDEAIPLLDKAIDRAILDGCNRIQVVHGHGTGRLREAVHEFLADHTAVKGFHPTTQGGGSGGATVVELKD